MSSGNNNFEDIVNEFSKRKLDYNYSELQRIKDRSHQIVAFFMVIISIVSGSLTATSIDRLLHNQLILGVLFTGFGLAVLTMSLSFHIMTRRDENLIINSKALYENYRNQPINDIKEVIRDSLFDMLDTMDKRNLALHYKMGKIYCLSVISLVIMFIPIIWLIFHK